MSSRIILDATLNTRIYKSRKPSPLISSSNCWPISSSKRECDHNDHHRLFRSARVRIIETTTSSGSDQKNGNIRFRTNIGNNQFLLEIDVLIDDKVKKKKQMKEKSAKSIILPISSAGESSSIKVNRLMKSLKYCISISYNDNSIGNNDEEKKKKKSKEKSIIVLLSAESETECQRWLSTLSEILLWSSSKTCSSSSSISNRISKRYSLCLSDYYVSIIDRDQADQCGLGCGGQWEYWAVLEKELGAGGAGLTLFPAFITTSRDQEEGAGITSSPRAITFPADSIKSVQLVDTDNQLDKDKILNIEIVSSSSSPESSGSSKEEGERRISMSRRWRIKSTSSSKKGADSAADKNNGNGNTSIISKLGLHTLSLFCPDARKFADEWKSCQNLNSATASTSSKPSSSQRNSGSSDENGDRLSGTTSNNSSSTSHSSTGLSAWRNCLLRRSLPSLNNPKHAVVVVPASTPATITSVTCAPAPGNGQLVPPLPSRRELEQRESETLFERQLRRHWATTKVGPPNDAEDQLEDPQDDDDKPPPTSATFEYKLLPAQTIPVFAPPPNPVSPPLPPLQPALKSAPPPLLPKADNNALPVKKRREIQNCGEGLYYVANSKSQEQDPMAHYKVLPPLSLSPPPLPPLPPPLSPPASALLVEAVSKKKKQHLTAAARTPPSAPPLPPRRQNAANHQQQQNGDNNNQKLKNTIKGYKTLTGLQSSDCADTTNGKVHYQNGGSPKPSSAAAALYSYLPPHNNNYRHQQQQQVVVVARKVTAVDPATGRRSLETEV